MLKPAKHTIRYVTKIRINTAMPRVATQRPVRNTQFSDIRKYWGEEKTLNLMVTDSKFFQQKPKHIQKLKK